MPIEMGVVVADSDPQIGKLLLQILSRSQILGRSVESDGELFSLLQSDPKIGCIVLDVRRNNFYGIRIAGDLKQWSEDISIVFVTTQSPEEYPALTELSRAVVTQPFSEEAVLKAVRTSLSRSNLHLSQT